MPQPLNCGISRSLLTSVGPFILDQIGSRAAAAYSVRRLSSVYSGAALRVRRNSDSAEQDIGFTPVGNLDQDALIAFVGRNLLPNSEGTGAVAGSPGTVPTGWPWSVSPFSGLTRTISLGTVGGYNYIDVRYAGTASATTTIQLDPCPSSTVAAAVGQTWVASVSLQTIAGSIPNTNVAVGLFEMDSLGNFLAGSTSQTNFVPTGSLVNYVRSSVTGNASCAFVRMTIRVNVTNGQAVDFTLRISQPQFERTNVSTYFPTSGVAAGLGFVTTVYDQSGNSRNATQATSANQPRIMQNGFVFSAGTLFRPTTSYLGSPRRMDIPTIPFALNSVTTNSVSAAGTNTGGVVVGHLDGSSRRWYVPYVDGSNISLGYNASATAITLSSVNTNLNVVTGIGSAANAAGFYNGTQAGTATVATDSQDGTNWSIGSNKAAGPSFSLYYIGSISESLIFQEAISDPTRQAIEKNQGTYYGITVA